MTLRLFNTLGRQKEDFVPIQKNTIGFYTCGPTVYNFAHIGNFRAYIAADSLRRWLVFGHDFSVKWVLNITDVDDKTIRDSQKAFPDLSPLEALSRFTRHYEAIFFTDLEKLNIRKADFFANPRATEYIPEMQDLIRRIFEKGFAKRTPDGVFFDVKKWSEADRYGKLLSLDLTALRSGTRSLADEIEKEDLADFALWKAEKPGEPAWDFDFFGENFRGRPGWHLECSAMEEKILGLPFDIHSGGVDLCFPHHEDEIAQSKCGYGIEPTRYWIHNEHLMVEGKKMSKSLGNFYTLADLLDKGHSTDAIRFFLATNHYRAKINLSDESLSAAKNSLEKFRNFLRFGEVRQGDGEEGESRIQPLLQKTKADFYAAMNDDLNAPVAIAVAHQLVSALSAFSPFSEMEISEISAFFRFCGNVFGVDFFPRQVEIPDAVVALAHDRQKARAERNWAEADRLRSEISQHGFEMRDTSSGFDLLPQS